MNVQEGKEQAIVYHKNFKPSEVFKAKPYVKIKKDDAMTDGRRQTRIINFMTVKDVTSDTLTDRHIQARKERRREASSAKREILYAQRRLERSITHVDMEVESDANVINRGYGSVKGLILKNCKEIVDSFDKKLLDNEMNELIKERWIMWKVAI